jgi:hypothetical protein
MANATLRYRQAQYKSCSLSNSREQDAPTTFNNYGFYFRQGLQQNYSQIIILLCRNKKNHQMVVDVQIFHFL